MSTTARAAKIMSAFVLVLAVLFLPNTSGRVVDGKPHGRNQASAATAEVTDIFSFAEEPASKSEFVVMLDEPGATPSRAPTKAQIEKLLKKMAGAKSYEERQPLTKELNAFGENAIPHLKSIVERGTPEIQRLAASALETIGNRVKRSKLPAFEDKTVSVRSELIVHGERWEDKGKKFISSSFRLWMEIENLTDKVQTLAKPAIKAGGLAFPISRWYEEDTDGQSWDGVLKAKEKKSILVIGDLKGVKPDTEIKANIEFSLLTITITTRALGSIQPPQPPQQPVARPQPPQQPVARPQPPRQPSKMPPGSGMIGCPCGCDRSAAMASELRHKAEADALEAIDISLETIAERENLGYITEQMIVHRLRLLKLAAEIGKKLGQ